MFVENVTEIWQETKYGETYNVFIIDEMHATIYVKKGYPHRWHANVYKDGAWTDTDNLNDSDDLSLTEEELKQLGMFISIVAYLDVPEDD